MAVLEKGCQYMVHSFELHSTSHFTAKISKNYPASFFKYSRWNCSVSICCCLELAAVFRPRFPVGVTKSSDADGLLEVEADDEDASVGVMLWLFLFLAAYFTLSYFPRFRLFRPETLNTWPHFLAYMFWCSKVALLNRGEFRNFLKISLNVSLDNSVEESRKLLKEFTARILAILVVLISTYAPWRAWIPGNPFR